MSNLRAPNQSDAEYIRALERRVRNLEQAPTKRVGDWVFSQDENGKLIATAPGQTTQDVGSPQEQVIDISGLRGFVTESQVAEAVSGGTTKDLSNATTKQVTDGQATQTAQYSADNANAAAAAIEARLNAGTSGMFWLDTFDRDAASDLGPSYTRYTAGAGGGTFGTDGSGYARQTAGGGAASQDWIDQFNTPTNTDKQQVTSVLNNPPQPGSNPGTASARHALICNANLAFNDRVQANVWGGSYEIGFYLSGTWTQVRSGGMTQADGDRYDFLSNPADHSFILLRNLLEVDRWTDVGAVYPMVDGNHRYAGMVNSAGTFVAFWVTFQSNAPTVQQITIGDRT